MSFPLAPTTNHFHHPFGAQEIPRGRHTTNIQLITCGAAAEVLAEEFDNLSNKGSKKCAGTM